VLKFKVTQDKKFIRLVETTLNQERTALFNFFKRKSKKAAFNVLVDRGIWDGMDSFITKNGEVAIGLWKEVYNFAERYGYDCEIEGSELFVNPTLSKDLYLKYVSNLLDGIVDERGYSIVPRDYQVEGAFRAIKYRFCTEELATSAGKTLIFYIYNSFLRDGGKINKEKKSLIIVPNVSLVGQTAEKFEMYAKPGKEWNVLSIGGKEKFTQEKFDEAEVVISTYQSLVNLPIEIFSKFAVVQVDEVHKSKGNSIRDILLSCINWEYRLGLSGTVKIDEEFSDFFRVQETVGPLVMVLSAKHLIDNGYSPNIKIEMLRLKYDESDPQIQKYWHLKSTGKDMYKNPKDFGRDMLGIEKGIIFESKERLDFISDLCKKVGKNTLVLFSDVKNGYGKMIQSKLLEWNHNTFYIDGEVDSVDRDKFKEVLESQDDVIIVASYGTFATGIDSKNLHHIVLAESIKAEITLRQAIGRGMRKLAEKNSVTVWDLVDGLDGYSIKHSKVREDIYKEQKFEISKRTVDLVETSQSTQ
jgi:superfamily II DNA or RNA helicase